MLESPRSDLQFGAKSVLNGGAELVLNGGAVALDSQRREPLVCIGAQDDERRSRGISAALTPPRRKRRSRIVVGDFATNDFRDDRNVWRVRVIAGLMASLRDSRVFAWTITRGSRLWLSNATAPPLKTESIRPFTTESIPSFKTNQEFGFVSSAE